jgi:hypothetical protein
VEKLEEQITVLLAEQLKVLISHTEGTSHTGLLTIAYYISYIGRVDVVACKASMPSRCG